MEKTRQMIKEIEVIVAEVIRETEDTSTLVLFTGNDRLSYEAGHFLTISPHQFPWLERWIKYLEDLKGRKEPPRAYSMSSAPDEKYLAITVKEEQYHSGFTPYPPLLSPSLVRQTIPGTRMFITGFTGPYTLGNKTTSEDEPIVHICAGSGIVPSYSILKHDLRANNHSKHVLIYSNKTLADVIFFKQLARLEAEYPNRLQVVHTFTREKDESLFNAKIRRGRVSQALLAEFIPDPKRVKVFTCGPDHSVWQKKSAKEKGTPLPPSFMGDVLSALENIGVSAQQIKKESYG